MDVFEVWHKSCAVLLTLRKARAAINLKILNLDRKPYAATARLG